MQTKAGLDGQPLWADVYLDGRRVGQTALTLDDVAAGRHQVEVRRRGYRSLRRTVTVRPGELTRVRFWLQAR